MTTHLTMIAETGNMIREVNRARQIAVSSAVRRVQKPSSKYCAMKARNSRIVDPGVTISTNLIVEKTKRLTAPGGLERIEEKERDYLHK